MRGVGLGGRHMVGGEASAVDNDNADQVTSNQKQCCYSYTIFEFDALHWRFCL